MATHSSTLYWKNPMDWGTWWVTVHGVAKSRTQLSDFAFTFTNTYPCCCILLCVCIYMYIYACVCICVCVYSFCLWYGFVNIQQITHLLLSWLTLRWFSDFLLWILFYVFSLPLLRILLGKIPNGAIPRVIFDCALYESMFLLKTSCTSLVPTLYIWPKFIFLCRTSGGCLFTNYAPFLHQ